MKKLLMLLIMIFLTVHLIGQEKEINDNDLKTWNSLTEQEKWESYKIAHNSYIKLKYLYDRKNNNETILIDDLEKTTKLLNRKILKNSVGLLLLTGLYYSPENNFIKPDCYAGIYYKRYCFYNRVYFQIGGAVKFYDTYGGAFILGIGVNF